MTRVLLHNACVWRWESIEQPNFSGSVKCNSWISIENGRIVQISDVLPVPDHKTFSKVVDIQGRLLLPGLMDAHIHVGMTGESQYFVDLQGCYSIDEVRDKLLAHNTLYQDLPWIIGVNWDQTKLGRYPTRFDLDVSDCGKPIFLWRACWHIGVANTAALKLAGVLGEDGGRNPALSLDIPGGVVEVDEVTSVPTGILKETATELMVAAVAKHKTQAHKLKYLSEGLALCSRLGLTAVQTNDDHCLSAYKQLQQECRLPARVFLTPVYEELNHDVVAKDGIKGLPPHRPTGLSENGGDNSLSDVDSRLIVERVKVFSDGSLGAETAALRSMDSATAGAASGAASANVSENVRPHTGVLVHHTDSLTRIVEHTVRSGYRIEIHAIGDAAAEQVLDCLEASLQTPEASTAYRPILTHCQVLGADLVERMARNGVVANIQPSFVPTDMRWVQARLTAEKQQYSYAWKTLLNAGVRCAGGSDAPIESPSPFIGMYDAIHRSNRQRVKAGEELAVFRPEEKLTFAEALWLYTGGAAYAAKCEHVLGQIAVGFAADFVMVDPRVVEEPSLLHNAQPDMVFVGGSAVHVSAEYAHLATPESPAAARSGDAQPFHDAPYVPGKGGRIPRVEKYFNDTSASSQTPAVAEEACDSDAPWCACILNGKYCMETVKLR